MKTRMVRCVSCVGLVIAVMLAGMTFSVRAAQTVYETPKQGLVIYQDVRVRTGPSTGYAQLKIDGTSQYYTYYQTLTVLGEAVDGNGDLWYNVEVVLSGTKYVEWIYGEYLELISNPTDPAYETYLKEQGFPSGYRTYLLQLHALHPDWTFLAYDTGLSWSAAVAAESKLGKNLIDGGNTAYRSTAQGAYDASTGRWIALDGSSWYAANSDTISYFMDPRNFLNSINIFMFLRLSFSADDTADVVQKLLDGTFMSGTETLSKEKYAALFYAAGKAANVNTVYLAALALQEQGTTGSRAITGESFTYNDVTYKGLYNFFNIGATSGTDNWKKGLIYANGGTSDDGSYGTSTSYGRPWSSPAKAITGGARFISSSYVNDGQDTMYLQKFNVTAESTYSHQYMTNVRAAYSQSKAIYSTFKESGRLDGQLTFVIPVFSDMPAYTQLPGTTVLPLPDPGTEVITYTGDFIKDLGLEVTDTYLHGFALSTTVGEVYAKFSALSAKLTVKLTDPTGQEPSSDALLASGQVMTVTDESGTSTYTYVMYGDVNGDGRIGLADLLLMKKNILGELTLTGAQAQAAMLNGETSVSLRSYLAMKKYILGEGDIDQ